MRSVPCRTNTVDGSGSSSLLIEPFSCANRLDTDNHTIVEATTAMRTVRSIDLFWRRQRRLLKVKAIGHVVRRRVSGIQRSQTERHLSELHEAHVRMHCAGNPALRVRTDDQAPDARSVTELRIRIIRSICRTS